MPDPTTLTAFEQATITFQEATITFQEATLALQQAAITAAYLQAGVALVVGLIQAGVVGWGIRFMARMGERREQQHAERHAEAMRTQADQHAEAMRTQADQHAETMEALRQQGEALRQQGEALRQQGEALRQQGDALRTLIERTAPTPGDRP